jgi:glutamine amidotransferase
MKRVAIVDYGMGNLRSVAKAIERVAPDYQVLVTADPDVLAEVERVVMPGQGAMPDCMRELQSRGLADAVKRAAADKPFLGICIGLQMLFAHSEEGDVAGLGLLPGEVRHFPMAAMHDDSTGARLKVPHMGWNGVEQTETHALWQGIDDGARFYFVHSYYVEPRSPEVIVGSTQYGIRFTSAVARANIFAVQFHPEKSAAAGLKLLDNFMRWHP